jgi:hypothetical protein
VLACLLENALCDGSHVGWDGGLGLLHPGLSGAEHLGGRPRRGRRLPTVSGNGVRGPPREHGGADIAGLVAAGDYDAVAAHCRCDVQTTVALAKRMGVL